MSRRRKLPRSPAGPTGRPRRAPAEEPDDRGLVVIHRCDQAEALVARSLLESAGIPALLRSRLALSVHPFTVGAQGEVAILVPRDAVDRGLLLLARISF